MQVSTVRFQKLNPEFRIDAEYYRAEILNRLNVLEQHKKEKLESLVDFVIGPFGSTITVDKYVDESKYRYVRNKDINNFLIKDDGAALIPKIVYDSLPQFHIKKNDLLITVVGTLGKVAIVTNDDTRSIFSCKSTIIRTRKINPFYLLTYLNSTTGKLFSLRGKRGAIQEGLNLSDLKEIQVFIPSGKFQSLIESTIKTSFNGTSDSIASYNQAKALLLSELGLLNWKAKHRLSFVKNYSATNQAGRIDAEYFQLKYDEIVNTIKGYQGGWDVLGNIVSIKKCVEVGSQAYMDNGDIPFVRVSNLSPFELIEEKYISNELYEELSQHQPQKGEILLSKDATPGIAYHMNEKPKKMIPSGGILRLKVINDQINEDYLTLVLNSLIVKEQINRDVGGSVILHWRPDQVKQTLIPILSAKKQQQIQQKIIDSFNLRRQSKHLLECAKRAVEIAIEKNEEEAVKWLQEQTKEADSRNCHIVNVD